MYLSLHHCAGKEHSCPSSPVTSPRNTGSVMYKSKSRMIAAHTKLKLISLMYDRTRVTYFLCRALRGPGFHLVLLSFSSCVFLIRLGRDCFLSRHLICRGHSPCSHCDPRASHIITSQWSEMSHMTTPSCKRTRQTTQLTFLVLYNRVS